MLKAYKYRIYPNNEQKIQIAKTFGCCRFVYNQTLAYRKEVYEKEKKSVSKTDCNNYCNRQLKKEYEWLKEVDKFALTNAIYNMDAAYQKFFKEHAGYPKFKSKHDNHKSYTTNFTNGNITVDFGCNRVKLPKLKGIKAKLHRNFSGQIKSATISQVPSGKCYVSILVETEHTELPHTNQNTGIDLGIKELCITSDGKKYENPKIIRKYEKKLVKLQRQLAHKEKRSQNYYKTKKKICLTLNDEGYPGRLRECDDAPLALFYRGNADLNALHVINMVGTRHATPYGQDICTRFLADLSVLCPNALIVSGLAYGIDIHAHRAALQNHFKIGRAHV